MRKMHTVKNGYFISDNEIREIFLALDLLRTKREAVEKTLEAELNAPSMAYAARPSVRRSYVIAREAAKDARRLQDCVFNCLPTEMQQKLTENRRESENAVASQVSDGEAGA